MAMSTPITSSSATIPKPEEATSASFRIHRIQNAENYQLLWLDESVNETQDNLLTQKKLRRTFSQLKTFDNVKECEKHVHNVEGTNQKMIMIVSGRFARKLIPPIHDIRELIAFYVYCMNKDSNKQWADNYRKVESYCLQKKFK
jgi:hypothetical protein